MFAIRALISIVILFVLTGAAQASVIINMTRIIFPSDKKEVTVQLTNLDDVPKLVQVWLDDGRKDAKPEVLDVPFQVLNPIFRMNAKKGQVLRLLALTNKLPSDRESVYWLNVLEVAPKPDFATKENYVQISFRTRIKLFYRPKDLTGKASEAGDKLVWKHNSKNILVSNPTPYYVSISSIRTTGSGGKFSPADVEMLAPFSEDVLVKSQHNPSEVKKLEYSYIDDLGATRKSSVDLK
jgi:chaperone protein EcpD